MALFGNKKDTPVAAKAPGKKATATATAPVAAKAPVKKATATAPVAAKAPVKKATAPVAAKAPVTKKVTKVDLLKELFKKPGKKLSVGEVLEATGYDLKNLRTTCGILRNPARTKEENLIDLRFADGAIQRVEIA